MGHNSPSTAVAAVALAIASMLAGAPAESAQVGYSFGTAIEYTDNADLAPKTDAQSDLVYKLYGGYEYDEKATNLDTRMALAGEYQIYKEETADDKFLGAANAGLVWKPFPSLFHWVADDTYTPTIDPQQKTTPGNIQHANIFSTGPDVFFHFGPVDTLNLGGRVVDARYQAQDGDNIATLGYLRWLHRTSERTTLSLNHERENVNYNDEGEDDFRQATNFAGLSYKSIRESLTMNYGYSTIHRDSSEDPVRTNIGSFVWDRFISGRTTFNLRLLRELGDAGSDVVQQVGNQQNPGVVELPNTTDVYVLREAAALLRWGITPGTRRASSVGVFWNDRKYEIDKNSDEQDQGITIGILWPFAPTLDATMSGSYTERDFYGIKRRDDETIVGVGLNYLLSRQTTVGTYVQHRNNNSTDSEQEYIENRIGIFVTYAVRSGRRQ